MNRYVAVFAALILCATPAIAHHGWGSYDAANPVTVTGPVVTSTFENPHVTITVKGKDKVWTVTLAPTSRMINRGALAELVSVGKNLTPTGNPTKVAKDEMRAERIRVDGKTYEMR
jgi:hypothetical protein